MPTGFSHSSGEEADDRRQDTAEAAQQRPVRAPAESAHVEVRFREAEARFHDLVDWFDDGYFEVDLKGTFTFVNEAYCRIVGRSAHELVGSKLEHLGQGTNRAKDIEAMFSTVRNTGQSLRGSVVPLMRTDGSTCFIEDTISLQRAANGEPVGFVGLTRDCTERHAIAERLRLSEARHRAILERIEDGYFEIDLSRKGRYEFVNDAFCRITGYSREELIGHSYATFFDDAKAIQFLYDSYHEVYVTGRPLKALEYSLVRKDGTRCHVEESVSLRKDASGSVVGFAGIRRDCTERKIAAEEIAKAKEAAESANRAKSEFLANMSHEIRTPMNGIIGMTELALDTELSAYQRECLGTVRSSAESLLAILNDILDFSKIESRKLELERTLFSLSDVLSDSVKLLALSAHQKNLELITDVPHETPEMFVGDAVRLRQVLTNLLGNAIKFTEHGHVMLAVREESQRDGLQTLRFTVSDTGIGVPADKQATIFDAFSQADGSTTRRFGGTGLGLAISSTLVKMMGGELTVSSTFGGGSTFTFAATFGAGGARGARPHAARLASLPVLIVDDNDVNRAIFERQLARWGMCTTSASTGQAALDLLAATSAGGAKFRLVLLDAQMPDVDGFDVAAYVASRPDLAGTTIVMLTSGGRYGDSERCRELGIHTFMTKPVRQADLFDALCRAILGAGDTSAKGVAPRMAAPGAGRSVTVLLAEDNTVNQRVAVGLLAKRGHEVTVAGTGIEVLAALDRGVFDIVLMDVQMPQMGGFEATAAIREKERTTGAPRMRIVAMTAHAMTGDRERCLAAGMDGYLSKPIEPQALFAAVEHAVVAPSTASEPLSVPREIFDGADALSRMGDDEDLLAEVQQLFIVACPGHLSAIAGAAERGDVPRLRDEAHSLKGAASNLSARRLVAATLALEGLAHDASAEVVRAVSDAVCAEIRQLLRVLQTSTSSAAA